MALIIALCITVELVHLVSGPAGLHSSFHLYTVHFQLVHDACHLFKEDEKIIPEDGGGQEEVMKVFYNTKPNIRRGTTSYIAKAIVNNLLDGEVRTESTDVSCCIS